MGSEVPQRKLRLMLSSRSVKTVLDDGAGGTIALVVAWPALWDFAHSRRLTDAALVSANRFLDELVITGPGLYRGEPVAVAPGGRR
ncbi:conserved hypothetical protein [Mesorhizobium ventifaucium]|uniref:Uncharacterized protein n=1 Tax=Mesorhizobium ventifaucium TaxID=666020 RepID=A0ABM9DR57_9HYPH|nr:conserved hypothetical protein [Mesorhizobium ventifaucium]